jgi:predicted PurR-regulated permease PerM
LISTLFITFFTMFYFFRDGPLLLAKLKYLSPLADDYED